MTEYDIYDYIRQTVIPSTPLTVAFVPAAHIAGKVKGFPEDAIGRVFVYHLQELAGQNVLHRTHSDMVKGSSQLAFAQNPIIVTDSSQVIRKDAQLGIIVDPVTASNYIYTLKPGSENVNEIKDSWSA